ncbi:glucosamine-6-phosphate deaminase [Planococcus antarcticus DSM 14505]|uniref:Glucosamine-6-phosphate deaminase n=1 Tax=Planococcus antarcticus DSM 14505 TaxID=1185653 RepID=A0ABM6D9D8_9BACL|nr:glucosamine-6-phosphate deaminase [Planococcus antarcticus]ANU12045.1 glucosamine-6-phosphate deaminase [Planococcus antarcticus DSM 14505]
MKLIRVENYKEMSSKAAQLVEQQILDNPHSVLGLATGSTPLGLYEQLIQGVSERGISYRHVQTINLDEYQGLSGDHPNSYRHFMNEKLLGHIDISLENTHIPSGKSLPVEAECQRYEALIDKIGPPHLQMLGMGTNGHIGFNEPGTLETSLTHCVKLEASTRSSNARFFSDRDSVPTHAITMGIQSILKSEQILVLASGKKKAQAVKRFLEGHTSKDFPASFLWKHNHVTLIVDSDAYSLAAAEEE